jgi:hypothetical protein
MPLEREKQWDSRSPARVEDCEDFNTPKLKTMSAARHYKTLGQVQWPCRDSRPSAIFKEGRTSSFSKPSPDDVTFIC